MNKVIESIKRLEGIKVLGGVSEDKIIQAENKLSLRFSEDYKNYLKEFGCILGDKIQLTGLNCPKSYNVVEVTMSERKYNNYFPVKMYIVESILAEGIMILQDQNGFIYEFLPNNKVRKINDNLNEYINSKV